MTVASRKPWPEGVRTTLTLGQDRITWLWQQGQSEKSNMTTVAAAAVDFYREAIAPEYLKKESSSSTTDFRNVALMILRHPNLPAETARKVAEEILSLEEVD